MRSLYGTSFSHLTGVNVSAISSRRLSLLVMRTMGASLRIRIDTVDPGATPT
jgi:hypothetical protein